MTDAGHGTSGGVDLTEQRVRELADEAARGYDPGRLRTRSRRGRPPIGREAATVFHVRLEPGLREVLEQRADAEETTPSAIVRSALREFLASPSAGQEDPRRRLSTELQGDLTSEQPSKPSRTGDEPARREVTPNPRGGWDVWDPHGERASSHHDTQREAIKAARRILRKQGGGELRVRGRDGRVRDQSMIPRDNDRPRRSG